MKIWRLNQGLNVLQDFESFQFVDFENDYQYFENNFDNTEAIHSWKEILIEVIDGFKVSECPNFWGSTGVIMLSHKAKEVLEPFIGQTVEFLPLVDLANNKKYYALHFLKYLNAIDYEKAELKKLSDGSIVSFKKYSFNPEMVKNEYIFKVYLLDRHYTTVVFVTEAFKKLVEKYNLEGFGFVEVWNSEVES